MGPITGGQNTSYRNMLATDFAALAFQLIEQATSG
jgi:hypothetical protein